MRCTGKAFYDKYHCGFFSSVLLLRFRDYWMNCELYLSWYVSDGVLRSPHHYSESQGW